MLSRGGATPAGFRVCAGLADDGKNGGGGEDAVLRATRITLFLLTQRIGQLTSRSTMDRLALRVVRHAPQLLTVVGVGPDTVVALPITMGDNLERLRSEASFAVPCGASPLGVPRAVRAMVDEGQLVRRATWLSVNAGREWTKSRLIVGRSQAG
ncbi:hypothetical protein [Streptomyces sp. CoH27]|uniref:hypothetical protein n=1 Tax=Streptomyces sp. CoH27 TaxID=2875763 RepID=UPI001CD78E84|nr:hypothetical protein [Streptomyces sp. CoH27]